MRVLLDECVPRRFRRELPQYEVQTVPEMGWASKENGELLQLAQSRFDVFVTTDQRLSYQQSVASVAIAVVVLVARRNKFEFLRPLVPELQRVLHEVRPGEVRRVGV
jgi:predicted nuclease of predicted toxin-antitoxin system